MRGKADLRIFVFLAVAFGLMSCASMSDIKVAHDHVTTPRPGTYTVILYSEGDGPHDPQSVSLLDLEGDAYDLNPWGADFKTDRFEGVSGDEAFSMAKAHVSRLFNVASVEIKEIRAPDGTFVGYEFRPRFQPFITGQSDLLLVSYVFGTGRNVNVYIQLHPRREPFFRQGNDGIRFP